MQLHLRGQHAHPLRQRQRLVVGLARAGHVGLRDLEVAPEAQRARMLSPSSEPRASSTARSRFWRAFSVSPMRPNTRPKIPWARLAARVSPSRSASRSAFSDA